MSYVSLEKSQVIGDEAKIYTENIAQHPLRFGLFTQPPPLAAGDPLLEKEFSRKIPYWCSTHARSLSLHKQTESAMKNPIPRITLAFKRRSKGKTTRFYSRGPATLPSKTHISTHTKKTMPTRSPITKDWLKTFLSSPAIMKRGWLARHTPTFPRSSTMARWQDTFSLIVHFLIVGWMGIWACWFEKEGEMVPMASRVMIQWETADSASWKELERPGKGPSPAIQGPGREPKEEKPMEIQSWATCLGFMAMHQMSLTVLSKIKGRSLWCTSQRCWDSLFDSTTLGEPDFIKIGRPTRRWEARMGTWDSKRSQISKGNHFGSPTIPLKKATIKHWTGSQFTQRTRQTIWWKS